MRNIVKLGIITVMVSCQPPPSSTANDAEKLGLCIAGDILKGVDDPVQIIKDCPGATETIIVDVLSTLEKKTPVVRANLKKSAQ
jgi:hypothetical protein